MTASPRPTTPADEEAIVALLARTFGTESEPVFVDRPLLRWKYWEPRADFGERRSLVIERNGRIVAHAGLWPLVVRNARGEPERGVHVIDWVSDAPGVGVSLLRYCMAQYDFVCGIGGSSMTRAIVPRLGFRVETEAVTWARPLRPWQQFLHHQSRDRRLPFRFLRNVVWAASPRVAPEPGWSATRATAFADCDQHFLEYLERCPSARVVAYAINRDGEQQGYFLLSIAGLQARIAGIRLNDPSPEHMRASLQLAHQVALRETRACELVLRSSVNPPADVGLRPRVRSSVYTYRRSGRTDPLPLQFELCDDDSAFRTTRSHEFLT